MTRKRILAVLLAMSTMLLCGCAGAPQKSTPEPITEPPAEPAPEATTEAGPEPSPATAHHPWEANLLALCNTIEEAEQIAEQYQIELVHWESGLASFYTDEDPQQVIDRGTENGWHELMLNHEMTIDPVITPAGHFFLSGKNNQQIITK